MHGVCAYRAWCVWAVHGVRTRCAWGVRHATVRSSVDAITCNKTPDAAGVSQAQRLTTDSCAGPINTTDIQRTRQQRTSTTPGLNGCDSVLAHDGKPGAIFRCLATSATAAYSAGYGVSAGHSNSSNSVRTTFIRAMCALSRRRYQCDVTTLFLTGASILQSYSRQ